MFDPKLTTLVIFIIALEKFIVKEKVMKSIQSMDWNTSVFLLGIFVLAGNITVNGWIDVISNYLSSLISSNIFLGYTLVVFLSVFLSVFIENVPFLAVMLPVAVSIC